MLGKTRVRRKVWIGVRVSLKITQDCWEPDLRGWRKTDPNWPIYPIKIDGQWRSTSVQIKSIGGYVRFDETVDQRSENFRRDRVLV